ncbi:MAG: helix-turn-helix transcriptional regulator [Ruminococcaceae bacterium]|nr:helix-turn-helix transcriptional regulator [Oscillospiraceae bacterium]
MYKNYNQNFCLKLKMLRLEAGMSQEELALRLGISRSCLANYEIGKRQPDKQMIAHIADVFHVMSDYLIDHKPFQNLKMCESEIQETKRLKEMLPKKGEELNISDLSLEHKIGMIEFYNYLLYRQKQEKRNN